MSKKTWNDMLTCCGCGTLPDDQSPFSDCVYGCVSDYCDSYCSGSNENDCIDDCMDVYPVQDSNCDDDCDGFETDSYQQICKDNSPGYVNLKYAYPCNCPTLRYVFNEKEENYRFMGWREKCWNGQQTPKYFTRIRVDVSMTGTANSYIGLDGGNFVDTCNENSPCFNEPSSKTSWSGHAIDYYDSNSDLRDGEIQEITRTEESRSVHIQDSPDSCNLGDWNTTTTNNLGYGFAAPANTDNCPPEYDESTGNNGTTFDIIETYNDCNGLEVGTRTNTITLSVEDTVSAAEARKGPPDPEYGFSSFISPLETWYTLPNTGWRKREIDYAIVVTNLIPGALYGGAIRVFSDTANYPDNTEASDLTETTPIVLEEFTAVYPFVIFGGTLNVTPERFIEERYSLTPSRYPELSGSEVVSPSQAMPFSYGKRYKFKSAYIELRANN